MSPPFAKTSCRQCSPAIHAMTIDGREVCHIKAAAGFRHKGGADKLGQYQRYGVIEHFHGVRIAAADQCPCGVQIRQMVLRQVLHLDEPTGIASGAVSTIKLD